MQDSGLSVCGAGFRASGSSGFRFIQTTSAAVSTCAQTVKRITGLGAWPQCERLTGTSDFGLGSLVPLGSREGLGFRV